MLRLINHIIISTWKESRLLMRDKIGLLVMFMMPAILVIITTLVQENVMEMSGEKQTEILYLDRDGGIIGTKLRQALQSTGRITLVELDPKKQTGEEAISMVQSGDYQLCIIIPAEATRELEARIQSLFDTTQSSTTQKKNLIDELPVYFDPGVLPGFRSSVLSVLQMAVSAVEMDMKLAIFEQRSKKQLSQITQLLKAQGKTFDMGLDKLKQPVLTLTEMGAGGKKLVEPPSAVQHNIPSWSLFGLFFTAIPLAGSLLLERKSGIWRRLLTMPVSPAVLLGGKIIAYIGVCFSQLLLIVIIGHVLFPYLGLPAFTISSGVLPLLVITLCSSLAACGYGILLGCACSTMEQASMFGSISIVVAAALGGTMVPTHAMPVIMQKISGLSPLNWGLTAFQDILIRNYTLMDITSHLIALLLFFLACLAISWKLTRSFT